MVHPTPCRRTRNRRAALALLGLGLGLGLSACDEGADVGVQEVFGPDGGSRLTTKNLVEAAREAGEFSRLLEALRHAGLEEMLEQQGPYTLFAPTDAAFDTLADTGSGVSLAELGQWLTYHLIEGKLAAAEIVPGRIDTVAGLTAFFNVEGDVPFINGARLRTRDIEARNGVIHAIDGVLSPPNIPRALVLLDQLSTLAHAVEASGLAQPLAGDGPFTLFAPSNLAFQRLPEGWLEGMSDRELADLVEYHVVDGARSPGELDSATFTTHLGPTLRVDLAADGSQVTLNGSTQLVGTDVKTTNGVIHIVDRVLLPPAE